MNKKVLLIVGALVFVALGYFAATGLYQQQKAEQYKFLASDKAELFVRDYSPRLGKAEAPVYLIEFLDPECESCRAFYPYVKKILEDFPDVQLVVRYAPFHHNSVFAVKILEASRKQGKYWEVLEAMFASQPAWGNHHNPAPSQRAHLITP